MIPAFTSSGMLPPAPDGAPYLASVAEVEERFVLELATPWRRVFFDGWDLLRQSIAVVAPSARWWLWGSFVTARSNPDFGDLGMLDAALLVDAVEVGGSVSKIQLIEAARRSAPDLHLVDIHDVVYLLEPDHPEFVVMTAALEKCRRRASRAIIDDISRDQVHAGFIEVRP